MCISKAYARPFLGRFRMKKLAVGAALLAVMPFCAQAQTPLQPGGFYIGAEGGVTWLFNSSFNSTLFAPPFATGSVTTNSYWNTGFVAGGMVGYDFVGPRIEAEGVYRENSGTISVAGINAGA